MKANAFIISLTIVSITSIIAIAICCLASLGYNSKISIEEEKIEVATNTTSIE